MAIAKCLDSGTLKGSSDMAGPIGRISKIRNGLTRREWTKVGLMAATVLGLNIVGWGMLVLALHGHHHSSSRTEFFGFGTGVLAYTLGMRHAFDADHIAAIDNTTRKLIQDGERPLSVGYFFSLGHSTIVFVLAVLLNFGIRALNGAVQEQQFGAAPLDRHHRHVDLRDLPVPDRPPEPRRPVLHRAG